MSELTAWIWLSGLKGIGWATAEKFLEHFGGASALLAASETELQKTPGATPREARLFLNKSTEEARRIEARCGELGIRPLCLNDPDYPPLLRSITAPPLLLYVKGKLPDTERRVGIGVVGTRRASDYGKRIAGELGGGLAASGAVTITGLAEGIDSAAAQGALKAHGSVVGVLGTGTDRYYPNWNRKLQDAVAESGALVSEYPPGTAPSKWNFPRRNRIISGLSLGVAVVQAAAKSGSLITAEYAQEQGRDVFVVPGMIGDKSFEGSHALIRDGAQLIGSAEDILEAYRFRFPDRLGSAALPAGENPGKKEKMPLDTVGAAGYSLREQLEGLSEAELKLTGLLAEGEKSADTLIRESGMPSGDALAALTMLQLRGYVGERNGQFFLEIH